MLKASLSWISLLMSILIQEYLPVLENYRIYIYYKEPFSSFSSRHWVSWFNINPSPTLCSIYCLSSFTWIRILKVDGQQKENTSYVKNTAVTSAKILITWIQLQDLDNVNVHMECFGVFSSWNFEQNHLFPTTQSTCLPHDFSDLFVCVLCVAKEENVVGLKLRRREAVCLPSQLKFLKLSRHHVKLKQTSCVISSLCKSATCQRHLSQLTEEVQLWNSHQNIKTSGLLDPPQQIHGWSDQQDTINQLHQTLLFSRYN